MKKRKSQISIALIGSYPPPFGGVSVHIKSLRTYLEGKGYHCVVYNSGKNKKIQSDHVVNLKGFRNLAVHLFRSRADVLHIHGGADLYKKIAILYVLNKLLQKKWLVTIHSGGIVKDLEKRSMVFKKMLSLFFNSAEKVICVSNRIKDMLASSMSVGEKKCVVIPAFSIDESLASASLPEDLKIFIERHHPILTSLGYSFAPHYGYDLAIQALKRLKTKYPDIGLVIMGGDKQGSDFEILMQGIENEALHRVFFSGDIEHGAALSAIQESDVFLRPTYHDGDSISVREALAMNVPVVASDTEKRPEQAVLFRKGDAGNLADKVANILDRSRSMNKEKKKIVDNRNLEEVYRIYQELEN